MASISGVSGSSSTSSIYGNRNIFTGLASGLDTESMIENSVAGYKTKIQNLINKQTKLGWKQDAYRNITDKLIDLADKYTSYTSKSNLMSNSFFNNAVTTTTSGKNAGQVSATGKSSSDIQINGVKQLATAATYRTEPQGGLTVDEATVAASKAIDWGEKVEVSKLEGTMTLTWGNKEIDLDFAEVGDMVKEGATAEENAINLAEAIRAKLANTVTYTSSGQSVKGSDAINVEAKDGKIYFSDNTTGGNSVYISGASGAIKETLGLKPGTKDDHDESTSFAVPADPDSADPENNAFSMKKDKAEYLNGKTLDVTLNGVTKTITIDMTQSDPSKSKTAVLAESLRKGLNEAFGAGKVGVSVGSKSDILKFVVEKGDVFQMKSDISEVLEFGKSGASNFVNTSKTLGEILGNKLGDPDNGGGKINPLEAVGEFGDWKEVEGDIYTDKAGNRIKLQRDDDGNIKKDKEGKEIAYRVNEGGEYLYGMEINGKTVGAFTKDTAFESVMTAINNNADVGVSVSYSKITNQFTFKAQETGANHGISITGGLAAELFGKTTDAGAAYTEGTDAVFNATINGENITMTRSSNVVDMDGLTVSLKGTFNEEAFKHVIDKTDPDKPVETDKWENALTGISSDDKVSFTTKADSDTIVDSIKSFVEDFNSAMKAIHDAYSTQPAEKSTSSHTRYEPLSDEDKDGMTDAEIERYEEKAKQGVLFGDSDLSSLYSKLLSAITPGGSDRKAMESIGISTNYEDGVTTLSLDENQLRKALDANPDSVKDVFAKTKEGGASTDGLMTKLKKLTDQYASKSIATPGILVSRAGTKKSSLSLLNNAVQKQIDEIDNQIDRWQQKMSNQIDRYTRQFSALEQMISQMNSQSSYFSSMMGGY